MKMRELDGTAGWLPLPERVSVIEVSPRDGLQNLHKPIATADKLALIHTLIAAGLRSFEVTSFVSPRAVPQMADAAEVMAGLRGLADVELTALVPNPAGAQRAAVAGVDAMVVFLSASESHNRKNLNRGRVESLHGAAEVARIAGNAGIRLQAAISTAFGCPFEGIVPFEELVAIARSLHGLGVRRVSLGDTTGMATPPLVIALCARLRAELPDLEIALHFHNTRGVGLACAYAGLQAGITRFEASIGGLGGCPFVPDATGNVCTEDLVYLFEECGVATGVNLDKAIVAANLAERITRGQLPGQVMRAGPRLRQYSLEMVRTASG